MSELTCLMCEYPKYTWFEVMKEKANDDNPKRILTELCDVHAKMFKEQIIEEIGN